MITQKVCGIAPGTPVIEAARLTIDTPTCALAPTPPRLVSGQMSSRAATQRWMAWENGDGRSGLYSEFGRAAAFMPRLGSQFDRTAKGSPQLRTSPNGPAIPLAYLGEWT